MTARRWLGGETTLGGFPAAAVERARSGKLAGESGRFDGDDRVEASIVAYAPLESAPWFVISRQPAKIAEVAQQRIRRATWVAALGAILLTAVLSAGAYTTVIRPLRRLIRAQAELVRSEVEGSEIEQLEASFELLQQRIQDSEDLGKVFLGRYQVTDHVGSGAMGSVFRGWDPKLRRAVALKTIRLNAEEVDCEKLLTSLLDEAAISACFNHPNIVTVYDVADEGSAGFIAMEYVDGVSLDAYLWRRVSLTPDEIIPLAAAIDRGLATAHQHGLVHHDVKPANVLLGFDGSVKVTDFGISQLITSAIKAQDVVCGTPGYLAPECLVGEGYTAADLFSLGLVLYEALVGKNPFFGRNLRETMLNTVTQEAPSVEKEVPGVPPELAETVTRLLAKDPGDRPPDATSVAEDLERMAVERRLTWKPDIETMKELNPRTDGTHTQLISVKGGDPRGARVTGVPHGAGPLIGEKSQDRPGELRRVVTDERPIGKEIRRHDFHTPLRECLPLGDHRHRAARGVEVEDLGVGLPVVDQHAVDQVLTGVLLDRREMHGGIHSVGFPG